MKERGGEAASRAFGLLLALLLHASVTRADVFVLSSTYDLEPLPDLEADFGPPVPSIGVEGVLKVAQPIDACQPFTFSDFDTPWIALISRQQQLHSMNCTFDIKVMHAELAGAVAAIVYDDFYESLIIMSMPKGHPEPSIPSVFVTERSGFILNKLLEVEGKDALQVRIMPVTTVAWLEALVSTLLGLMSITMVVASFYAMRSWGLWLMGNHRMEGGAAAAGAAGMAAQGAAARSTGLPANLVRSLPVIIYDAAANSRTGSRCGSLRGTQDKKGGQAGSLEAGGPSHDCAAALSMEEGTALHGSPAASSNSSEHDWPQATGLHAGETKRVCTICLEDYSEGEKVRVLPCLHRFHKHCVDQWLSSRRMCPVCKHDAGQRLAPDHPSAQAAGGGGGRRSRLAWLGSSLRSWLGIAPRQQPAAPEAEALLSPAPPLPPTPTAAAAAARTRGSSSPLQQSRLWDLYMAYAALDSEPGRPAAAAAAGGGGRSLRQSAEQGQGEAPQPQQQAQPAPGAAAAGQGPAEARRASAGGREISAAERSVAPASAGVPAPAAPAAADTAAARVGPRSY